VFGCLWDSIDGAIRSALIVATEEVLIELERGDEHLLAWVKERKEMFIPHHEAIQVAMTGICARWPTLVDHTRMRSTCDPWVIAVAQVHGLTVVTEENSKPSKPKIPDVCRGEGITCINLLGMVREFGWTFR
jgi:hypothetical protein